MIDVIYIQEKVGNPPPTLCILKEAVKYAEKNGFEKICIVCAKLHKRRISIDSSRIKTYVKFYFSKKIDQQKVKWLQSNNQPHTSSEKEWDEREKFINFLPFFVYKFLSWFMWKKN